MLNDVTGFTQQPSQNRFVKTQLLQIFVVSALGRNPDLEFKIEEYLAKIIIEWFGGRACGHGVSP